MLGVEIQQIESHRDTRGELGVLEWPEIDGFVTKRLFFIKVASAATVRAEHSVSADQVIAAISGGVTVDLDNGHEQTSMLLKGTHTALRVRAGVWLRLRDFEPGTIVLVASSLTYAETRYYDVPRPELLSPE